MIRRTLSACLLLALASSLAIACKKDKIEGEDAAADAASLVVLADAAPEAQAPAASALGSDAAALAPPPVAAKPAPKPDPPICVQARNARGRNSPVAPKLEAACKAAGGTL
jgi:hypothetical protein